jgi:hypothetical protein
LRNGSSPFLNSIKGKSTMKKNLLRFISTVVMTVALAGCGGSPVTPALTGTGQAMTPATDPTSAIVSTTEPASSSSTADACSTGQVEADVQRLHSHMREFDDASILASNLPREQLSGSIADLQRIRREAEDEQIPACLIDLKKYQVQHMNSVIDTLIAFMGGTDTETLERGIAIARELHDQYTLELARLLGLTVVPATVPVLSTPAETATP